MGLLSHARPAPVNASRQFARPRALWHAQGVCRLFGFRSVIPSQVHRSLLAADNALGVQSNAHPDGWGVAFYVDGAPHLTRSAATALGDQLFHRLSGVVASDTVLAHVRRATQGAINVLNCHPFQHGRWVFAHNGDIPCFPVVRERLLAEIDPGLRRFILGDTDSEVVFYMLLTELVREAPLKAPRSAEEVAAALRLTLRRVRELCAGHHDDARPPLLTCMVTNGETLVGCQGGKELFFSTYKTRCADRDSCRSLSASCEAPSASGVVNHFIVSSEPLQGENVWLELEPGDIVGIDADMRVTRARLDRTDLPQWRPCA
jgi:glutamine amidotransferase